MEKRIGVSSGFLPVHPIVSVVAFVSALQSHFLLPTIASAVLARSPIRLVAR